MPAGGTWSIQNKRRPGAYINFVSVPRALGTLGERGTVAIALPMTWGPENELLVLTKDDLIDGSSLAKIGYDSYDVAESLPFRLALSGASRALLYRTNTSGGAKASAELESGSEKIQIEAKYKGTVGNDITIVINSDDTNNIIIMYRGIAREKFTCSEAPELEDIDSKWVEFTVPEGVSSITPTSGLNLAGGENGTLNTSEYSTFLNMLDTEDFQCLAIEDTITSSLAANIKLKIVNWREARGKKVTAVVYDAPNSNHEGIISVNQGFKTEQDEVTRELFPIWVASMTAGCDINQSLTALQIEDATEIIGYIPENEIVDNLNAGKFILTYRQDGAVCVEQDINTLTEFTIDKNDSFSKNRVIRCLDEIGNTVATIFNRNYCGKVDNNSVGRDLFKTEIISLLSTLQDRSAIQNFDGATDITILEGNSVDSVVVDLVIQPVDSMEKLYMTVNVNA